MWCHWARPFIISERHRPPRCGEPRPLGSKLIQSCRRVFFFLPLFSQAFKIKDLIMSWIAHLHRLWISTACNMLLSLVGKHENVRGVSLHHVERRWGWWWWGSRIFQLAWWQHGKLGAPGQPAQLLRRGPSGERVQILLSDWTHM